jgi:outer membrane protein OmpA-like peptidoglycan-associated protein
MKLRNALLASAMVALPLAAEAQPVTGLYIGGAAGWNRPQDSDLKRFFPGIPGAPGVSSTGTALFKSGFVGLGSIGWGFGNGLRAEVEGNYRQNDFEKVKGFSPFLWGHGNAGGIQTTYGVMANVFYDFDLANFGLPPSLVQPYIGAGVGYAWNNWNRFRATSVNGIRLASDDIDGQFAFQGIAGLAVPLEQWGVPVPGLSLTAEYRFFGTENTRHGTRVFSTATGAEIGGARLSSQNLNHSVLIGLRYALFQPPPPPVAAPAPAPAPAAQPARTYLVFFDWDRYDLTARAREIISEAAQNSKRMQVTRIEVAGHADRSGSAAYNQRLSQRRADTVAAELVRDGVNRSDIVVQAFGETRPLVPTADGVREPQNRRVEIVLR